MSKASSEYPSLSTEERTNHTGYFNNVIHITSVQEPTVVKLGVYILYQQRGGEQEIPSHY